MALSPIMLTAWAVSEIPHLEIDGYRETSTDDMYSVLCRTADDRTILISSPQTAGAAAIQDVEHRVGQLLSAGVRERLPFAVPHTLGAGSLDKARIVVTEMAHGTPLSSLRDTRVALPSLAVAIAALHSLPPAIVTRSIIPTETALETLRTAAGIIDRAHQSNKVPALLLDRWDAAIEDAELWHFSPTIVHGGLDAETILTDGAVVSGLIGWSSARVSDPAIDLAFVCGHTAVAAFDDFCTSYLLSRPSADRRIGHRARFWSELDVARWLLHGIDLADESIIADAVGMLGTLSSTVADNPAVAIGKPRVLPTITVEPPAPVNEWVSSSFADDAPTATTEPL